MADQPKLVAVPMSKSIPLCALIFTIIEAPEWGWASGTTLTGFAAAAALLASFVVWELRTAHPMLPVRIFRNPRFSAASFSVTSAFFALFGFIFLVTQDFQLVRGGGPLEAGLRTVPVATAIAAVTSPKFAERFGTTRVVSLGLALMGIGFLWVSTASTVTPYMEIVGQMFFLGTGLGLATAPATESIMGSLSADRAGIGSAVNDTTRELGGTLDVAIIGSVFSSIYINALGDSEVIGALPESARHATEESVAAQAGSPVFIDFTAEWCLTCKINEKTILNTSGVRESMAENGIIPLKADWTNKDETITTWLQRYGKAGVPFYLVIPADKDAAPIPLPEVITPALVKESFEKAAG